MSCKCVLQIYSSYYIVKYPQKISQFCAILHLFSVNKFDCGRRELIKLLLIKFLQILLGAAVRGMKSD